MRLFLVRHGQTTGNLVARYNGQKDVPLTELGQQQAAAIRPILEKFSFDRVYTSDLSRTVDTQRFALPGAERITTPLLREIDVGSAVDREYAQVRAENPGWIAIKDPDGYRRFGGESMMDVCDRVKAFFDLLEKDPCDNAIAFTHNGYISAVMCHILGSVDFDRSALRSNNCSIHILEREEKGWRLLAWNYMGQI